MKVLSIVALGVILACAACKPVSDSKAQNFKVVDCSYFAMTTEILEFEGHNICGSMDNDGLIQIKSETMTLLYPIFDDTRYILQHPNGTIKHPEDLRCLPLSVSDGQEGYAYVNRAGVARLSTVPRFPSCNEFRSDGIVPTYINGKFSYFDREFHIVKKTQYEFVYGNIACSVKPQISKEDHGGWIGGKCGRIDRDLTVIVPIEYSYESVPQDM